MPIEKLQEFARDGQKNTDELSLTDGFPVVRKPARQWFNYLFNIFSLKINEIIDLDPIARNDVTNNLTTNEVQKPLSAAMGKKLQDEKLAIADLVNNLISGGEDKALTAEQGKLLLDMFSSSLSVNGYQKIANPKDQSKPIIIQWGKSTTVNGARIVTLPIAFPNSAFIAQVNESAASQWLPTFFTNYGISSITNTNIDVRGVFFNNGTWSAATAAFSWLAVGY